MSTQTVVVHIKNFDTGHVSSKHTVEIPSVDFSRQDYELQQTIIRNKLSFRADNVLREFCQANNLKYDDHFYVVEKQPTTK